MAALDEDTTKGCSIKINGMFSVQKIDFGVKETLGKIFFEM